MEPEVSLDHHPSLSTYFKDELIYSVKRTRRRRRAPSCLLQNKWLLYSSTLILLTFIFLSCGVTLVTCAGASQDSNDISAHSGHGRHVDRIPQKFSISSGGPSDLGTGSAKSSHKNSNHDSNEVHSTFHFPSGVGGGGGGQSSEGEDEGGLGDEDDEGSYEDEDASYYDHFGESGELKPDDVQYLDSEEKGHHGGHNQKPQIAKCCPYGDAIAADGQCKKFRSLEAVHNQKEWFPKKVFDLESNNLIDSNISEWDIQTAHSFQCGPNESAEIVSDVSTFAIVNNGNLFLMKHKMVKAPLQFCVDQQLGKGEGRVVKSCFSREELCGGGGSGTEECLRKCCPHGALVDERSSRCTRTNLSEIYNFHSGNWTVLHEKPDCQYGHSLVPINSSFTLNPIDGSLVTPEFVFPFLQYCVDHFINLKVHEDQDPSAPLVKVLMCFNQTAPPSDNDPFDSQGLHSLSPGFANVIGIALVLSATSIAIAALVSWRLPELRSLHGKCQLSHLATLFGLFSCLAIVQLGRHSIPMGLCKFFAVFIHTCALSSFLWLNLLCFNIYMTFRSLRPPLSARRDENRRLFFLCIYAWGIPASFVAFLFILDSQPGRLEPMPRPEYGVLKCLMSTREAEFAYLFGPVGVLLLINGILFCLTAQELLCGLWRLDNSDSITFRRKSMGLVVAKLGIVMGMGWILDVLGWGFGRKLPFLFYMGDVFNALQGVFICIVLLWRKRVLEVLHLRKPSITKDETLTVRPFLPKNGVHHTNSHLDNDTSLVIVQEP